MGKEFLPSSNNNDKKGYLLFKIEVCQLSNLILIRSCNRGVIIPVLEMSKVWLRYAN